VQQVPVSAGQLPESQELAREQQVQPASAQLPPAAELQVQPRQAQQALRAPARLALPGAVEPLWPPLLSHPCPPWPSLQRPPLHPLRPEGACEPSRLHPSESSWSASSFLLRRTRATGR
jgi:hypothetical protein